MKPHVSVFLVLMIQVILALAFFKFSIEAFYIWTFGCLVGDIFSLVIWGSKNELN